MAGEGDQRFVSGAMPEVVVDQLEAVQIQVQNHQQLVVALTVDHRSRSSGSIPESGEDQFRSLEKTCKIPARQHIHAFVHPSRLARGHHPSRLPAVLATSLSSNRSCSRLSLSGKRGTTMTIWSARLPSSRARNPWPASR